MLGNGSYDALRPVATASADATAMAEALERVGFEVTVLTDAAQSEIEASLATLAPEIAEAEAVVLYVSGHAIQLDGANRLVPRDAAFADRASIAANTIELQSVMDGMAPDAGQLLVFLDAARVSPLPLTLRAPGDKPGLAAVEPGLGQFVALATQPDVVAPELGGALSLFTAALVEQIEVPGQSVSDLMVAVQTATAEASNQGQLPWAASNLSAQFYFNPQIERQAGLTEADLAMINNLDDESLNRLLVALGNNGVALEIIDVEEEEGEEVASLEDAVANPILELSDVEEEGTDTGAAVDVLEIEQPEQVGTSSAVAPVTDSTNTRVESGQGDAVGTVGAQTATRVGDTATVTAGGAETVTGTAVETVTAGGGATTLTGTEAGSVSGSTATTVTGTVVDQTGGVVIAETTDTATGEEIAMLTDAEAIKASADGEAVKGQDLDSGGSERPSDAALAAIAAPPAGELPLAIQTELARVGCHRGAIDGSWGPISRVSLLRYYAATGSVSEEDAKADPTELAYKLLKLEPGVVCEGTVAPVVASKSTSSRTNRVVRVKTPTTTKTSSRPRIQTGVTTDPSTGKKKVISSGSGAFR